jgi:hypothetical protein
VGFKLIGEEYYAYKDPAYKYSLYVMRWDPEISAQN